MTTNPYVFTLNHKYNDIYLLWQKQMAAFWTPNEVKLTTDIDHWNNKLNDDQRHTISKVLAFFAASDGIVNSNLLERFMSEFEVQEIKAFYGLQYAIETIHSRTYAMLIEAYISDV